jgi:hypothetical protein
MRRMMSNKMIGECKNCGDKYCMECTECDEWQEFCSDECKNEYYEREKFDKEYKKEGWKQDA